MGCKIDNYYSRNCLRNFIELAYQTINQPCPPPYSPICHTLEADLFALERIFIITIGIPKLELYQPQVVLLRDMEESLSAWNVPREVQSVSYIICSMIMVFTSLIAEKSSEALAATSLYLAARLKHFSLPQSFYLRFNRSLTLEEIRYMASRFQQDLRNTPSLAKEHVMGLIRVCRSLFVTIIFGFRKGLKT